MATIEARQRSFAAKVRRRRSGFADLPRARIVQSAWNEIAAAHVGPQDHRQLDLLLNTYGPLLKRHGCRAELLDVLQFLSDRSIFGVHDDHVRAIINKFDRLKVAEPALDPK